MEPIGNISSFQVQRETRSESLTPGLIVPHASGMRTRGSRHHSNNWPPDQLKHCSTSDRPQAQDSFIHRISGLEENLKSLVGSPHFAQEETEAWKVEFYTYTSTQGQEEWHRHQGHGVTVRTRPGPALPGHGLRTETPCHPA